MPLLQLVASSLHTGPISKIVYISSFNQFTQESRVQLKRCLYLNWTPWWKRGQTSKAYIVPVLVVVQPLTLTAWLSVLHHRRPACCFSGIMVFIHQIFPWRRAAAVKTETTYDCHICLLFYNIFTCLNLYHHYYSCTYKMYEDSCDVSAGEVNSQPWH